MFFLFVMERGAVMRRSATHLILAVCLFAGLTVSSVLADLGLQQIFSDEAVPQEGLNQVGFTVKAATEEIYSSTEDREQLLNQLTAIPNEAAETGNGEIVRYTIVGVIVGGGPENLDLSKEAIDNSKAFTDFPAVTASTVSDAEDIISARSGSSKTGGKGDNGGGDNGDQGGGNGDQGGGDEDDQGEDEDDQGEDGDDQGGDGDDEQGGGDDEQGGGDDDNPFDDDGDADIDDDDIPGTPV